MGKVNYILVILKFKKVLLSNKISSGEKKTINTLLVTYIMIIRLSHYI